MKTINQLFIGARLRTIPLKAMGLIAVCLIFIMGLSACNNKAFTAKAPKKSDEQSPTAVMVAPSNTTAAPVDTDIVIHLQDTGSGVNQSKIIMKVDNSTVSPGLSCDQTDCILNYNPLVDFDHEKSVSVYVEAKDRSGNFMSQSFGFVTEPFNGNPFDDDLDTDNDGISDFIEEKIMFTNKNMKTLFVKPGMKGETPQDLYWPGFLDLLPLKPFKNAGIEVVVIGNPNNPYDPMRNFNFDAIGFKDPQTNIAIPCDIMAIRYMGKETFCEYGSHNQGHTYFFNSILLPTWYWDTKGYTPNETSPGTNFDLYNYYSAFIYPFPLENYFIEGAYTSITAGMQFISTFGYGYNSCYDYKHCSPMNLNDGDYFQPAYLEANGVLDMMTVEFNPVTFDQSGTIKNVGTPSFTKYYRKQVLTRTIIHEMGHALLTAANQDHCSNPKCIMYSGVVDWDLYDFGSGPAQTNSCPHGEGGTQDIRELIHNTVHLSSSQP